MKDVKTLKDRHGLCTFLPAKLPCEAEAFLPPLLSSSTPKEKKNKKGTNRVHISEQITLKVHLKLSRHSLRNVYVLSKEMGFSPA